MSHISSSLPSLGTLRVVPANHGIAPSIACGMAMICSRVGAAVANISRHVFWPPELFVSESSGIAHHTTKLFIHDVRTYLLLMVIN
jgi:hypothetical protein